MEMLALVYTFICYSASVLGSQDLTREGFKWVIATQSERCSQPCDGGLRDVTYKCSSYDRETGTAIETRPDYLCSKVSKPPAKIPCNQHPCRRKRRAGMSPRYEWMHTGQWTHCIDGCVKGKQCIVQGCFDNELNKWLDDQSYCEGLKRPFNICQTCQDYMSCPAMWSVSGWSACSRTCGRGTRVRSVSCVRHIGTDNVISVPLDQCQQATFPHRIEVCGMKDCKPKFIVSKWSKCLHATSQNCGVGTKKRKVICSRLAKTGRREKLPFRKCFRIYGHAGYPKPWETCRNYKVPLSEECKARHRNTKIFIHTNNATVVQMRRLKRLTLQVGETAYVFPYTSLIVKCPITGFDARDLTWAHNHKVVGLRNRRVHMNYLGRLKIKHMKRGDVGSWQCIARNETASINLNLRYPSEGYREYFIRLPLLTIETKNRMLSDSPGDSGNMFSSEMVQWVANKWSSCSSTCGKQGMMYRKVQCERIKDDYYKVYEDSVCLDQNLPKPRTKQSCGGTTQCPEWQVQSGPGVCTDTCISVGKAILKDKIRCMIGRQALPDYSCDSQKKPIGFEHCNNTDCIPRWTVSSWSQCSRSCGGQGVMARHLRCLWNKSERNAGGNCYRLKLKAPVAIKACQSPPCVLECIDLTSRCKKIQSSACRFPLYQRFCCRTCLNVVKYRNRKRKV